MLLNQGLPIAEESSSGTRWKLVLATLFALFAVAMIATFIVAGQCVNRVVDSDYYRHESATGITTGWKITPAVEGRELRIDIRDKAGTAIVGGIATFQTLAADTAGRSEHVLTETAPGNYQTAWPGVSERMSRGMLHFQKDDKALRQKVVVILP